jgi:hypothetical protein
VSTSMHRLQISLPRSQVEYLTERARREGISIAELIRRLIHRDSELISKRSVDSVWSIVGISNDAEQLIDDIPVSEDPDLYLAEQAASYSGVTKKRNRKPGRKRR